MSDMPNLPPEVEKWGSYGIVSLVVWFLAKFGQQIVDFVLQRMGISTDRRYNTEDSLREQVAKLIKDVTDLTVKVQVMEKRVDGIPDIGRKMEERLARIGVQDDVLDFLVAELIAFEVSEEPPPAAPH